MLILGQKLFFVFLLGFALVVSSWFFYVYSRTIHSLDGVKKMYLEGLEFEDNPAMLEKFKTSGYYTKMMDAKSSDSVRYYYKQFFAQKEKSK